MLHQLITKHHTILYTVLKTLLIDLNRLKAEKSLKPNRGFILASVPTCSNVKLEASTHMAAPRKNTRFNLKPHQKHTQAQAYWKNVNVI